MVEAGDALRLPGRAGRRFRFGPDETISARPSLSDFAAKVCSVGRDEACGEPEPVAAPGRAMAAAAGMAFPPGVLLDGEPFSYGRLSERKLRRELARHAASRP